MADEWGGMASAVKAAIRAAAPYGIVTAVARRRVQRVAEARVRERAAQLRSVRSTAAASVPRLNMGCGVHHEPGWINADSAPRAPLHLSIHEGEPLPFAAGELEAVHSEHFIEHIDRQTALWFIRESARSLRGGGVFRASCPDLEAVAGMLRPDDTTWRGLAAIYEAIGDYPPGVLTPERVVNHAFYGHEHRYLWTLRDITRELDAAGFTDVRRMPFGESRMPGVAIETRTAEAPFSLIVEATRA